MYGSNVRSGPCWRYWLGVSPASTTEGSASTARNSFLAISKMSLIPNTEARSRTTVARYDPARRVKLTCSNGDPRRYLTSSSGVALGFASPRPPRSYLSPIHFVTPLSASRHTPPSPLLLSKRMGGIRLTAQRSEIGCVAPGLLLRKRDKNPAIPCASPAPPARFPLRRIFRRQAARSSKSCLPARR